MAKNIKNSIIQFLSHKSVSIAIVSIAIGSRVVKTLKKDNPGRPVRFSFSHLNNFDEIDVVVNKLVKIFEPIPV